MNHGEARCSGGRSPSSWHSGHRQNSGTPATTVDRPFGESSGSRSRGSQARGIYTPSSLSSSSSLWSPRNSLVQTWVKKSSPVSSVEDHDTAHKSGDADNASNESETRPFEFDLFLKTKVFRLKPSILELSKDKEKATKGIVIRPGMVLLKNYLSINDQVMILNKCRQLGLGEGGFYQPGFRDGGSLHLKMMCLGKNWDCETRQYGETRPFDGSTPPQIPVEFNRFVEKAIEESQSLAATNSKKMNGEDEMPFMSPDIYIVMDLLHDSLESFNIFLESVLIFCSSTVEIIVHLWESLFRQLLKLTHVNDLIHL